MKAISQTLAEGQYQRSGTFSCHVNQLAMLQRHGLFLKNGGRLLVATTFHSILETGFIDDQGISLPQEAFIIQKPDAGDLIAQIKDGFNRYSASWIPYYIRFGISAEEILSELRQRSADPEFQQILNALEKDPANPAVSAGVKDRISRFVMQFEENLFQLIESEMGLNSYQFLEVAAYKRESLTTPAFQAIFRKALATTPFEYADRWPWVDVRGLLQAFFGFKG